ncbi:MAG: PilZ domain-containing protein [Magnetococcales bacterium]|nr:PilZ domain-containing protein [Magnetococcales bacterium]MBF0322131.1 PilZ domain-containing protein [Magnetococcales bacterium]
MANQHPRKPAFGNSAAATPVGGKSGVEIADPTRDAADKSRRQWERSTFSIRATLTLDLREFLPLTGVTEDVSLGGAKFRPSRTIPPIPIGIEGSFVIALGDGPMTFRCRTVRITPTHIFLNLLGKEALFGQAIAVEALRSIKKSNPTH